MKKLTAEQLKTLEYGQKVYRFDGNTLRGLRFVGLMPSCKNYLIFEDGEYLTHLHISSKDNSFNFDWYSGEYNSEFAGNLLLKEIEKRIETIKKVYLKSN